MTGPPYLWGRDSPLDPPVSRQGSPDPLIFGIMTILGLMTGPLCLWGRDNLQVRDRTLVSVGP